MVLCAHSPNLLNYDWSLELVHSQKLKRDFICDTALIKLF